MAEKKIACGCDCGCALKEDKPKAAKEEEAKDAKETK